MNKKNTKFIQITIQIIQVFYSYIFQCTHLKLAFLNIYIYIYIYTNHDQKYEENVHSTIMPS